MGSNPTRPATNKPAIFQYLLQLKKDGLKDQTIESHPKILRYLSKHLNVDDPEAVRLFIANLHVSSGRKANLVDAYGKFAKSASIAFGRPHYVREETLPFIPLESETETLINACRSLRHATTLRLLKETGMRIGEAGRLQFKHFDFEKKTVRVIPEKNSKPRELRLSDSLVAMLKELFGRYPSSPFPTAEAARHYLENTRKILSQTNNNPRFLNIHLHTFRHFKATMLYSQTKDILYVQRILGHKWLTNTLRYTQLLDFKDEDQYVCKAVTNAEEAAKLIEAGFSFETTISGTALFKKRK